MGRKETFTISRIIYFAFRFSSSYFSIYNFQWERPVQDKKEKALLCLVCQVACYYKNICKVLSILKFKKKTHVFRCDYFLLFVNILFTFSSN